MSDPLVFSVVPGGGSVTESGIVLVDEKPVSARSTYRLEPDRGVAHQYRITRPPFDPLNFTVQWDANRQAWLEPGPHGFLPVEPVFYLSRTIRIDTVPGQAQVVTDQSPLEHSGEAVLIPHAWNPPDLLLARPLFKPVILHIPEGALAAPDETWPAHPVWLPPSYGPFSYWPVDVLLALSILVFIIGRFRRLKRCPASPARGSDIVEGWRNLSIHTRQGTTLKPGRVLGRGGMSVVLEMPDPTVAVKLLLDETWHDPECRERFSREIDICSRLQHPAIVRALDWGEVLTLDGPRPWLLMERLYGETLRLRLGQGPISRDQALAWTIELLEALQAAHAQGIIHRDVKPDNVMMLPNGHLKLMDFGVARDLHHQPMTKSGCTLGTPLYMSPEHLNARTVQPQSDVYSVGVMLYQMLSGQAPYAPSHDLWGLLSLIAAGQLVPLSDAAPDLPPALYPVVMRMLAVRPEDRYPSAAAAADALTESSTS